jgi:hypothetical protein
MTKDELKALAKQGWDNVRAVAKAIKELTENNPLVVFDREKLNQEGGLSTDELYDLPIGYTVDKYETYLQGAIMFVQGNQVKLHLTGEDFGQEIWVELDELPFESQLQLLTLLSERA